MIISGLTTANAVDSVTKATTAHGSPADKPVTGRALVSLEPSAWRRIATSTHPDASFVTHLIATATQAPQTRTLRRVSTLDAQKAYATAPARPMTERGTILSQTI